MSIFHEIAEQFLVPKQLRFPKQGLKDIDSIILNLETLQEDLKLLLAKIHNLEPDAVPSEEPLIPLLCEIITDIWRAYKRTLEPNTQEPYPELRRIYRPLQSIFDTLAREEFELIDRTNQKYDIGLTEKVLAAEKKMGLDHDIISEMIKPTIFYKGNLVQRGEIIITTPEN